MAWHPVEGRFIRNRNEVRSICEKHFGPEHKEWYNKHTGAKKDNHGNWSMSLGGFVHLRYKKDVAWFLLLAGHLADPTDKGAAFYYCPYIPTGIPKKK